MSLNFDDDAQERTRGLLRLNGPAYRHLSEEQVGDETAFVRPSFFIMWCPPSGRVLASPTVELAQNSAATFAGGHPGTVAAVYQLVGYSYVPLKPAPFVAAADAAQIETESK